MGKVSVSMDGLRTNLTNDFNELSDFLKSILEDLADDVDQEQLIELINQTGRNIGSLNCISLPISDDFNELWEKLEIKLIDDEENN
tara:strand:+ start:419 stop:676 length:258 start_codon:yes stop_codon:yes gene_type:complete